MTSEPSNRAKEPGKQVGRQGSRGKSRLFQPHLLTGHHHRGYLPHFKHEGATYWVTFHLADSLPQHVLRELEEERKEWERQQRLSTKVGRHAEPCSCHDNAA